MLQDALELAKRHKVNLQGILAWALEFEDQPFFAGFRALRTRDIDLPVMNGFRMFGLLGDERVQAESSGGLSLDRALASGARSSPDVNALATRGERAVSVLVWNYQDDDVPTPPALIHLTIQGITTPTHRALLHHYRVDQTSSDAYSIWRWTLRRFARAVALQRGAGGSLTPRQHVLLCQSARFRHCLQAPALVRSPVSSNNRGTFFSFYREPRL